MVTLRLALGAVVLVLHTDRFVIPLPERHSFPISKYTLLAERVRRAFADRVTLREPHAATDLELSLAHDPRYVERVVRGELTDAEVRRIGFPWSPGMVERSRRSVGATIEAARAALADGIAVSLSGGTHHAFRDRGEGYCVFNDTAVTTALLLRESLVDRVLVLDCDVHQGNGTAAMLRDEERAFTFSIHGASNFPRIKEPSDLDIPLADDVGDGEYLDALADGVETSFERARPDVVFYLAGADPLASDRLGRLSITKAGLRERDRRVLARCRRGRVPVVITMAGGYAPVIDDTVDVHFATVEEAVSYAPPAAAAS